MSKFGSYKLHKYNTHFAVTVLTGIVASALAYALFHFGNAPTFLTVLSVISLVAFVVLGVFKSMKGENPFRIPHPVEQTAQERADVDAARVARERAEASGRPVEVPRWVNQHEGREY